MHRRLGVVLVLLATLLGGCAGDDGTDGLHVETVEMKFLPRRMTVTAGRHIVKVSNTGKLRHTFSINSIGSEVTVNPGETKDLEIEVEAGTYRYVCRVLDHEGLGMRGALQVRQK